MASSPSLRWSDIALTITVVGVAAMLVLPLHPLLIDFLITINLAFSIVLLLVALYLPSAVSLLAFPSILLLSTLFRLALNVASSRLILTDAYAGEVIHTFGSLLVRGEVVVGIIIFTIVTIVNFIVIAKGASRVSEVAARFALDAMPGKQLAIDADLRSGVITPEEAQRKREDLRKESMLYGSMDGGMKFVQGDAIAGIFIILTNILGGMYIGVSNGMPISDAVQTYTILTVGDGLVSQIPALLISICAGILVTRVSSSEGGTLASDLATQLFSRPATLGVAGAVLLIFSILPDIPFFPFFSVGAVCIGSFLYMRRRTLDEGEESELDDLSALPSGHSQLLLPADDDSVHSDSPLLLSLDAGVLYRLFRQNVGDYRAWWRQFQADYYQELGIRLPELRVVADEFGTPSSWSASVGGSLIDGGTVLVDAVLVETNPSNADIFGLQILSEAEHPLSGGRVMWALKSAALKRVTEAAGVRVLDPIEYICIKLGVFFRSHPEECLSLADVYTLLKSLEKKIPGLVSEVFQSHFISTARLTELLHELVRQGVSVRDFQGIVEAVSTYCTQNHITLQDETDLDLPGLVSFVRYSRRRQIVSSHMTGRKSLRTLVLGDDVEALFENVPRRAGADFLGIDPDVFDRLREGIRSLLRPTRERGVSVSSLLCRGDLLWSITRFLSSAGVSCSVISYDELEPQNRVEQVGTWSLT